MKTSLKIVWLINGDKTEKFTSMYDAMETIARLVITSSRIVFDTIELETMVTIRVID